MMKKMFTNGLKMGLLLYSTVKMTVEEAERYEVDTISFQISFVWAFEIVVDS